MTRAKKIKGDQILLELLGALIDDEVTLSADAIAAAYTISKTEAKRYLEILLQVSLDDGISLPLWTSDNGEMVGLRALAGGFKGRPLRLLPDEEAALQAALNAAAVPEDSSLRLALEAGWSSSTDANKTEQLLAPLSDARAVQVLGLWAQALYNTSRVSFNYQGQADSSPQRREVDPLGMHLEGTLWYLDGFDVQRSALRMFRYDRIEDICEIGPADLHIDETPIPSTSAKAQSVELVFNDKRYLDLFDWPGLQLVLDEGDRVRARISYLGGDWLVRRLAACGGSVELCDETLAARVRAYAQAELNAASATS